MRYDPTKQEQEIRIFWKKNKIKEKARKKGKKQFYFLDGPPYTSGKIHLGTAWNKTLKDMVTRYKRMQGFDVWDRAGYDMHGLPTEGKVQAKLKMKTKEEILKYGLAKFVGECKEFAVNNLKQMNKDFENLGVWLDFDNAYQTIADDYIEGTWWLVKKAHEKKRLYEGQMTMTWCGSCQTSLAKHELEYKDVVDKSIYVKFPLKNKKDEFLIIWTTTPWTIPYNLGVMVNPNLDYVKAKVGKEVWILAEELLDIVIKEKAEKDYKILEKFKGKKLEGVAYKHPMDDILGHHFKELRKKAKKLHVVVLSEEFVTTEQGTGLVHMAPGCGPEDYEVGHREGIPPFNRVDEEGFFDETMGPLSNLHVKKNNETFIDELEQRGSIVAMEDYNHDYAHCWRCKNPILYRTTTQWFFKVEDLIPKMRKLNKEKIDWVPDWAGSKQFDSWLENLRDNGITRQRFWGSPLPVWRCKDCEKYVVVESREELKKLKANKIPKDLHKPWIDEVTIPCKCGSDMHRIPDIMDVWIDAGVSSWASLGFPHNDKLFKKLYPADFITEGKDQIRGWFNLLFVASMLALEDISFKACYMTGFVNDAKGRKMSKSLGNVISPDEVTDKYGVDTFRYYAIGSTNPGLDMNYNFEDVELKKRNLTIFWNLHKYVMDMAKTLGENPEKLKLKNASDEEHFILSKLHSTIKKVTEKMDSYLLNEVPLDIEDLYMELSRTYIQMIREKVNTGTDKEKENVLYTVYTVLKEILKLMAPVAPFITEMIYQNFKGEFGLKKESIHLYEWPKHDKKMINEKLEQEMESVKDVTAAVLAAREKAQIGIRWPLPVVFVETEDKEIKKAIKDLKELVMNQTNVKEVKVVNKFDKADTSVKPNFKVLGPEFGPDSKKIIKKLSEMSNSEIMGQMKNKKLKLKINSKEFTLQEKHLEFEKTLPNDYRQGEFSNGNVFLHIEQDEKLISEGYTRELVRRIQSFRKDAGLHKKDSIELHLQLDKELYHHVLSFKGYIKERVGAKKLFLSEEKPKKEYKFSDKENVKGLNLKAGFSIN